jgi:CHAT domain-containing protein
LKKLKKIALTALIGLLLILFFSNFKLYSIEKKDSVFEYSQLFYQAEQFRMKGEFIKSIEIFKESLSIAKKILDEKKECKTLLKLGILYWNIAQLDKSLKSFNEALFLAQKVDLKDKQEECNIAIEICKLYDRGKKYRSSGEFQKSIETFQQAAKMAKKIESKEHEIKCCRQIGVTHYRLNNLRKFFSFNKKALKIAEELKHRKEEGRCLNNIGTYYWNLNNYSLALNYYERAFEIARKEKDKSGEGICLTNIGIIYKQLGNYDRALEYFTKVLKIDTDLENWDYISMDLNDIGTTYRAKGVTSGNKKDLNKAIDYYQKCLSLIKKGVDKQIEVYVLNNMSNVYTDLKRYSDALKFFELGYKKAKEIQDIEAMGMILTNMGIVYYNQENYEESTKYYQEAINLSIGKDQILWEAYMESARAYEKQKDYKKALEFYKKSIKTTEDIRSTIDLEELKAKFLGTDKRIDAYHYIINLLANPSEFHPTEENKLEAFNYLEKAKARAFLDSLELSKVDLSEGVDPELLNREKEIMKDISQVHTKLQAAEPSPEAKKALKEDLKKFENELETLKREMRRKSPAYADIQYPEIIKLKEVQEKLLDGKTAFFEYCIGKEHSFAFAITKKDLKIFPLPKRENLQAQIVDYLKAVNDKDNHNFQPGYNLFTMLVLPGLDKNIKNIIFIPDDILHFFPFETLITHSDSNEWLIKNYNISYAPSISSLREIIQRKKSNGEKPRKDILAFGDPYFGKLETEENGNNIFQDFFSSNVYSAGALNFYRLKYSGIEIDKISLLFKKSKIKVFRRKNASEEQLKKPGLNLEDYKIIHFATHSIIDNKIPARSSIVLSLDEDQTEDGFLQMREIYNLKLNSDLVTLSSCQTGLGELIRGEGIEGINRAFFYAGTSSVLMSLWAVHDQASYQLMERFYYHLRSSESIKNALRKAKLEMINSGVLSHPYYWAGFIASGKTDKVVFPSLRNKLLFFGSVFLLASGLIIATAANFRKKLHISF